MKLGAQNALFFSHFLTQWGDRMWGFGAPILFVSVLTGSLFPSTFFTFACNLCCVFVNPLIGALIDRTPRLRAVQLALLVQNGSLLLCSFFVYLIARQYAADAALSDLLSEPHFLACFAAVVLFGCTSELASNASRVAVDRDWVCVIAKGDVEQLSALNAVLRRIELFCSIAAPFFFALLLDMLDVISGLFVLMLWNAVSVVPEYLLLTHIYAAVPELAMTKQAAAAEHNKDQDKDTSCCNSSSSPWAEYMGHRVCLASLAYVLLFATLLSDGVQMIAYLRHLNVPATTIALFRGASSLMGIVSTFAAVPFLKRFGNVRSGQLFLGSQLACLYLACAALYFGGNSRFSTVIFLVGIVLSRFGLWGFDLVETGLMQLLIEDFRRGAVNGVESSLTKLAWLSMLALGMVFSAPEQFHILIGVSLTAISLANILYAIWWKRIMQLDQVSEKAA